jgi:hypothetical protein
VKKLSLLFLAATVVFSFSSCKKCSTCSYSYTDADGKPVTMEIPEVCGKKSEIEEYEASAKTAAALYNGTATCN